MRRQIKGNGDFETGAVFLAGGVAATMLASTVSAIVGEVVAAGLILVGLAAWKSAKDKAEAEARVRVRVKVDDQPRRRR